jgi:hypothetical protein
VVALIGAMGTKLDTVAIVAKKKPVINFAVKLVKVIIEAMSHCAIVLESRIDAMKYFLVWSTKKMNDKIDFQIIG